MNFGTLGTGFGGLGRGGGGVGGVSYEAESETLFAAMSSQPDDTRKGHINTLIAALKTAGIWTKLDVLWVLAAHDAQAARLNWKNPASFALTAVNSPTFTADRGYAGDGATSYLNTGWDATNNGSQFTLDAAHLAVWNRTARAANTSVILGSSGGGTEISLRPRYTANVFYGRVSDTNGGVANSSSDGLLMADRSDASTVTCYRNGSSLGSPSGDSAGSLNAFDVFIGCNSFGGTPADFTSDQVATASLGGSIGAANSDYHTAMAAYMMAVGA